MSIKHSTLDYLVQQQKQEIYECYRNNDRLSDSAKLFLNHCLDEAMSERNTGHDTLHRCFFHDYTKRWFKWSKEKSSNVLKELTSDDSDLDLRVIYERYTDEEGWLFIVDFLEIASAVNFADKVKHEIDLWNYMRMCDIIKNKR